MNTSPRILNKKELDQRKNEVYRQMELEIVQKQEEHLHKTQAKKEVKLIQTEILRKSVENEYNEEFIFNTNVFLDEFKEFSSKKKDKKN
jgi:hypothetical protein